MSLGFFTSKDFKINNPAALGDGCGKCRLWKTCNSPRLQPRGEGTGGIMIIGERPGRVEDKRNSAFINDSSYFLDHCLQDYGVDTDQEVVRLYAVNCHPPEGHVPTDQEIEHCRGRVWGLIKKHKPKVIVPLGAIALKSLLAHRWNETDDKGCAVGLGSIARWRGWEIPDRETNCWIVPTINPAQVLRTKADQENHDQQQINPATERVFLADLKKVVRCLTRPLPTWRNERECVEIITDEEQLANALAECAKAPFIVIDYETTGLKPQNEGHRIVYIGIAIGEERAFAFPTKGLKHGLKVFRKILSDKRIPKIAHNLQFEDYWSRERLGVQVQNWRMCTMQTAHVLDQRKGINGLKFQSYAQTGLVDYSSHIAPYLRASAQDEEKYGDNAFNRIYEAPPKEVMMYCGIDCIATYRLALIQAKKMGVEL